MALFTFSSFYTAIKIDPTNQNLNFNEGIGELLAVIEPRSYTLSELSVAVKTALDAAGTLTYTVTVSSRADRLLDISSTANFDMLTQSGTQAGASAYATLGYSTVADLTAASSYTSSSSIGFKYRNQALPQAYVDSEDLQERIDPAINESASGVVEVVSYGVRKKFEFDLIFITSRLDVADGTVIQANSTGLENARSFMQRIITKETFEFMPDRDAPGTFFKVILEATPESNVGVAYKMKELVGENIPGVYDIGKIVMRVVT